MREVLAVRQRQTQVEDAARLARPSSEEPKERKAHVDLSRRSAAEPLDARPLVPYAARREDCVWHLEASLRRLEQLVDDVLAAWDLSEVVRYRERQLRSFPGATPLELARARVVTKAVRTWLARRRVAGGPRLETRKALRTRMYAAQVEAQVEGLERIAAELRALSREAPSRRRRQAEQALSRREASIGGGTMPPVVSETERYAAAEAALRLAWIERVERPT